MTNIIKDENGKWIGVVYSDDGSIIKQTKPCRDRKEVEKEIKKL